MKFRTLLGAMAVVLLASSAAATAEQASTSVNSARFETLKKLAGEWVEIAKDGKPGDKIASSIRVTAGGSAVHETLFPGTPHEMVTLYHLDGPDLVLTHYCILGNQPRMRAEPGKEPNQIAFKFTGGGNLKSDDEHHMHQLTLTILSDDHFRADWVSCQNGKECELVHLDLVRKQK